MTSIPEPLREKLEEFEKWTGLSESYMAKTSTDLIRELQAHIEKLEKMNEMDRAALAEIQNQEHLPRCAWDDECSCACRIAGKALEDSRIIFREQIEELRAIESLGEKTE